MNKAVLASLLLLGCTDETTVTADVEEFDIINGDAIPASQLPFVGMVRITLPNGIGTCSGSLLSDRVVLTAAHCLPDNVDWTKLTFTTAASLTGATHVPVVDGRMQFFFKKGVDPVMQKGDIALLKLATPLPQSEYPALISDPLALVPCILGGPCHALTIAGYGMNSNTGGHTIKRSGSVAFYAWATADENFSSAPDNFQAVFPRQDTIAQQLCQGDSGGPAFVRDTSGKAVLTGVAHAVYYDPADGTCSVNNLGVYSSVHPYRDWIIAKHRELAGLFGDLNRDNTLDTLDLDAFGIGLRKGTFDPTYDIDNDGDVDRTDGDRMVFDRVRILYGDINGDGYVEGGDFLTWQRHVGKTTGKWTDADMNFDGKTDSADLNVWKANYGKRFVNVEPSTVSR